MESALDLAGVLALLQAGRTVLFPSQEAAEAFRQAFARRQHTLGLQAWEPPKLFAWEQWLDSLWDALTLEGLETRVLLNRLQEETLWADTARLAGIAVLSETSLRDLAREARSALTRAALYRSVDSIEAAADSPDAKSFASWHRAFAARCRSDRLLPKALLPNALTEHVRSSSPVTPAELHLIAFHHLSPAADALVEVLRIAGTVVHTHSLRHTTTPVLQASGVIPGDLEAELRWGVRWLRQYLQQSDRAESTVALILPDPEGERPTLEPMLRDRLAPELETVAADLSSTPWRFSTGQALADQPMIAHALLLLRWLGDELSTEAIGTLLLSPYLQHRDDLEQRARFEMQTLRKSQLLRPEISLASFLALAESQHRKSHAANPPLALPEWHALDKHAGRKIPRTATYGDCTEHIRKLLQIVGWPGPRVLSPSEFRLTEAWDSVLDLIATLDLFGGRATYLQILDILAAELQKIAIQEADHGTAVQILRASETEGRLFDAVLILRATENTWPAPEPPQPLLGWALQSSHGMPGTDAARTHAHSLDLLRSLAERTPNLLLLTAAHDANGPLRLTELARGLDLPVCDPDTLLAPESEASPLYPESLPDSDPLPPLPSHRVAGGARVLELQAHCGFRAYAGLRLCAEGPEVQTLGPDPRASGQDLHKALEIFWAGIPSQEILRALTPAERHAAVAHAVAEALRPRRSRSIEPDRWTEAYLDIAERRLTHLMLRWLDKELSREPFSVITQEEKRLVSIGPLELNVRPDRIDKVEGGVVFIDYKTSSDLSADDWLGERPKAPQLPLYALLAEPEEVRGLAFGRLRAGREMGWISLQADEGLFPGKNTTSDLFTEQITAWRDELARLASEFAGGAATVDPKSYPGTCQYCGQRLLCRLDPADLLINSQPSPEPSGQQEDDPAR